MATWLIVMTFLCGFFFGIIFLGAILAIMVVRMDMKEEAKKTERRRPYETPTIAH